MFFEKQIVLIICQLPHILPYFSRRIFHS